MSDSSSDSYVTLTIDPKPATDLHLHALNSTEELGRPFLIVLDVFASTPKVDLSSLLGASATVAITKGRSKRYFNGIVARAEFQGLSGGQYHFRVELRPWIWLLSFKQDCRIYQNMAVWDIITSVFRDQGFSSFEDKRQNQAGSQTLEYCVQYDESSFAFVTRLMERYGIYYYYLHSDGDHTIAFADDPSSHDTLGTILFRAHDGDMRVLDTNVSHWTDEYAVESGSVVLNDYNFTTPSADLKVTSKHAATHKYANFEIYEYPGLYGVTADGQKLSDVRMQNRWARGQSLRGATNSRDAAAGRRFTLSKEPGKDDDATPVEYLVVASSCSVELAEAVSDTEGGMIDAYRCALAAIPSDRPFRLDFLTPWPVMRGPQTAKVVGESGDEITTDSYGRIKVQFPWDRLGTSDQNSSCFIRVAQTWAGAGWGTIFIPRIGMEVVVDFLDGDPDRPLVTGCVYNATQTVPYALPDNKTRSTIKTNSSTGGGGFNELRFEDKAGSEEVFFQAQKDYNKVVLNNETVNITQDTTTTVQKGNRSVTISEGNNTFTVSKGDNTFSVSTGKNTSTVEGDNSLTVNTGKNSVTVSTGDNELTVSQGKNSRTVSLGNDETTVSVGDHKLTVSAGSSTISAGQEITIKAGTKITLQVGSNSITIAAEGITISAAKVTATAESSMSLTASANMSLKGAMIAIN